MQATHEFDPSKSLPVGWGVRVLLLTSNATSSLHQLVAGLGGLVEVETETYAALSAMIDDPLGYGLFVIDCDDLGGTEAGMRAVSMLVAAKLRVPAILISKEHRSQLFPQERDAPVCLRAPISSVSMRVGFEHALRDRLIWRAA